MRQNLRNTGVDYRDGRGLDKKLLAALGSGDWIRRHHSCLITGPTSSAKTLLAGALDNAACRQRVSVQYIRQPGFCCVPGQLRLSEPTFRNVSPCGSA